MLEHSPLAAPHDGATHDGAFFSVVAAAISGARRLHGGVGSWPLAIGLGAARQQTLNKPSMENRPGQQAEAAKMPRQQAAKTLGGFNTKLVTNGLEIIFHQGVIQCRFLCTPVSATRKYSVISMCIYHALKEPKVQLLR